MPKKYRLSRSDFTTLKRVKSRRVHGTYFSLTVFPLPQSANSKTACVVSKKIAARAVVRNAIDRKCREVVRPLIKRTEKSVALVFHAKREAADTSFAQAQRDILTLLERSGLRDTMAIT